jgi:hypothetical protein
MTHRTGSRIVTVLLAPAAAVAAWALIRLVGIDLDVSQGDGTVGAADVIVAALIGALAGWVVVRFVERHSQRPRHHWAIIGSTALAVSIIGPSWLADGASAGGLMVLHTVVAVVVIGGFAVTLPVCQEGPGRAARQSARRDPA